MSYARLPFRFFVFRWGWSKAKITLLPHYESNPHYWVVAFLGFELGRFKGDQS